MRIFFLLVIINMNLSAQGNTWKYIRPYELPMLGKVKQSLDGSIYVIHANRELYKLEGTSLVKMDSLPVPMDDQGQELLNFDFNRDLTIIQDGVYHLNNWFSYYTDDNGQSYNSDENNGEIYSLRDVQFLESGVSYGVKTKSNSMNIFLVRSESKGINWEEILEVESQSYLEYSVFNQDSLVVFTDHSILFSGNGGQDWENRYVFNDLLFYEIYAAGKKVLLTYESLLYESVDYGYSFQIKKEFEYSGNISYPGPIYLSVIDAENWIVSNFDNVYTTNNGGQEWERFNNSNTLFCPGISGAHYYNSSYILLEGNPRITLLNTLTGEFEYKGVPFVGWYQNFSVVSDSVYYLLDYDACSNYFQLSTSSNQGYTWDHITTFDGFTTEYVSSIDFVNEEIAYYCNKTSLYIGVYPFKDWTLVSNDEYGNNSKVIFINEDEGIIYGKSIAKYTNDGGVTFDTINEMEGYYYRYGLKDTVNNGLWIIGHSDVDKTMGFWYIENGEVVYSLETVLKSSSFNGCLIGTEQLYINSENGVFTLNKGDTALSPYCSLGGNEIVYIISEDSLIVFDKSYQSNDMYMVTENCGIEYQIKFPFTNILGYGGPSDFHFTSAREGFAITSGARMLKLTDNFREDLLISTKEEKPIPPKTESLYLYPNPAYDRVYINKPITNPRIVLYDLNGRMMKQSESQEMEIGDMGMGMYFYVIMDGGEYVGSGKLVVVR